MKRILFLCVGCIAFSPLFGQVGISANTPSYDSGISEKLISLAFQNPQLEVADHQVKIAEYNLSAAKGWWAENLSLSFNANEYSLKNMGKAPAPNAGYVGMYPLYNMGINIPIGGIFSKPQAVKAAKERVAIAENQRKAQHTDIRTAVLTAYQNYLSGKELYTVQSQLTESAYSDYLQSKEKFRNGGISVSDYNDAANRYQDALKARISAENSFKLTQIQLEALIGVPLSTVLTNNTTQAPADSTTAQ